MYALAYGPNADSVAPARRQVVHSSYCRSTSHGPRPTLNVMSSIARRGFIALPAADAPLGASRWGSTVA